MDDMPRLRVELNGMQRYIMQTMLSRNEEINEHVKKSMAELFAGESIKQMISAEVISTVRTEISKGIKDYYGYGEGQKEIQALVLQIVSSDNRLTKDIIK